MLGSFKVSVPLGLGAEGSGYRWMTVREIDKAFVGMSCPGTGLRIPDFGVWEGGSEVRRSRSLHPRRQNPTQ